MTLLLLFKNATELEDDMGAGVLDIVIEKGATYELEVTWQDADGVAIDLTGYTADMQIRSNNAAATADVTLTEASGLTLGGAAGTIAISIDATTTASLPHPYSGRYDLLVTTGSTVKRILQGSVTTSAGVTIP